MSVSKAAPALVAPAPPAGGEARGSGHSAAFEKRGDPAPIESVRDQQNLPPANERAAIPPPVDDDLGDEDHNARGIGGSCSSERDCPYSDSLCLTGTWPGGTCSLACTGLCPDAVDADPSPSHCIEDPEHEGEGICASQCDWSLYPLSGCRDQYACVTRSPWEGSTTHRLCLPEQLSPAECVAEDIPQPNIGIEEPPGLEGCPAGMAPISGLDVCIDRWEPSLVEVFDDGSQRPWSPYFNPDERRMRALSAPGAVPQGYISEVQAAAACAEAGKRLCTSTEWLRACRGLNDNDFPYGDEREWDRCNDRRDRHPAVEYFETSEDWIWHELDQPCINQLENGLDLAGVNKACVTQDQVYDLVGNLHEWIDDPEGTFRGGYYVDTWRNGDGCTYTTRAHGARYSDYSTGFRCCAD